MLYKVIGDYEEPKGYRAGVDKLSGAATELVADGIERYALLEYFFKSKIEYLPHILSVAVTIQQFEGFSKWWNSKVSVES
jgi:hypothetical protein